MVQDEQGHESFTFDGLEKPMRKPMTHRLLMVTAAAVIGLGGLAATSADAAIIVDAVPTDINASIDRTLDDGVTVTGANLSIVKPANTNVDPTAAAWGGNLFTYVIADTGTDAPGGGLGNVTYEAAAGSYFQGFDARIIGNVGQLLSGASNTLARFTFEGSTDGVNFSPIAVTGTTITGAGLDGDWTRVSAVPTDLGALGQVTHLRIGMNLKASGGEWWHQQFGAVSLDQTQIPEPASMAMGLMGLTLIGMRRRRFARA
jgi:hypothetical protein